jgi:hypothetical protein
LTQWLLPVALRLTLTVIMHPPAGWISLPGLQGSRPAPAVPAPATHAPPAARAGAPGKEARGSCRSTRASRLLRAAHGGRRASKHYCKNNCLTMLAQGPAAGAAADQELGPLPVQAAGCRCTGNAFRSTCAKCKLLQVCNDNICWVAG